MNSKRLSIYRFLLIFTVFFSLSAKAQTELLTIPPKYEIRAVWLTTLNGLDWPKTLANGSSGSIERQKLELVRILDQLKAAGINVVLLQTRVRATTIYPSAMEPWDGCLSGTAGRNPGYDALQFAIDECHKRGMQLHAWVVTIPIGKWTSAGCAQLRKRYPSLVKKIGDDGFMDPEKPQTATYIADICEEIVKKYDIDGIHLDYIRYPETWKIKVSRQQGRRYITAIAEAISQRVKRLKPWVMMSCSPIGKHDDLSRYSSRGWNARTVVCQDAQEWLRTGTMDALFPMMYFRDNNFFPFAIDWQERSYGKIVAPGLATYMLDRREGNWPLQTVAQEMNVLRQLGLGHTHFRSRFLTDNTKGIYAFERRFNSSPALIPPMTWLQAAKPDAPREFRMRKEPLPPPSPNGEGADATEISLSWKSPNIKNLPSLFGEGSGERLLLYNVYASPVCPVDISDPRNLVATRLTEPHITFSSNTPPSLPLHSPFTSLYYAITTLDRFGNESEPLQSHQPTQKFIHPVGGNEGDFLFACNGKTLQLPEKPATLDANTLAIETLQGTLVATRPWRGNQTDVSTLPEGFYQLRSLNRKGITHRLGFFQIKRH
ncbi:MAG: family 10 glycosylhydrolase [Prevotella sp.]|nr:family 10 glycosylhydrolase [Prevotella sp.]